MAKEVINIRLPEGITTEQIDAKAQQIGLSRSAFITKAIEVFMHVDPISFAKIQSYANQVGFPVGIVLQNTFVKDLAYKAAKMDVWGPSQELAPEFASDQGKYIVGDELFLMLYGMYKDEFTQEKIKQLLEEEIYGTLTEAEEAFLIQHRAGKTWLESDEYKKESAFLEKHVDLKKRGKGKL